jgi:hypothetical protein
MRPPRFLFFLLSTLSVLVITAESGLAETRALPAFAVAVPSDTPIPLYKAPKDKLPHARVDGGARGGKDGEPVLVVLAPADHIGVTTKKAPCLFWYVSPTTAFPVEFVLEDNRLARPLLEAQLRHPVQPGIQKVCLEDYSLTLEPGVQYRWHISLIVDAESRSKDIHAMGMIERMGFVECSALGLPCTWSCDKKAVYQYAEAGLWYDALECISELIDASPEDRSLSMIRDGLLGQGFPEIHAQPTSHANSGLRAGQAEKTTASPTP